MSVVQGEDVESDEELGYETPEDDTVDKIAKTGEKHSVSNVKSQGTVVSGEESETDDEEETLKREKDLTKDTARNVIPVKEQQDLVPSVEPKTSPALARRAYTYNRFVCCTWSVMVTADLVVSCNHPVTISTPSSPSDPHIQLRKFCVCIGHGGVMNGGVGVRGMVRIRGWGEGSGGSMELWGDGSVKLWGEGSDGSMELWGEGSGGSMELWGEGSGGSMELWGEGSCGSMELWGEGSDGSGGSMELWGEGSGGSMELWGEGSDGSMELWGEGSDGSMELWGEGSDGSMES